MNDMQTAAEIIQSRTALRPEIGVVLGSGLGAFAGLLQQAVRLPYRELPGLPLSTAVGHAGELVVGTLATNGKAAVDVAVLSGRFHLYEGYSPRQVTSGIRLFHAMGVKTVILTCAAGGLNTEFSEGALVLISDHISLQGANPLVGPNDEQLGPRFPDMTHAYAPRLRQTAKAVARENDIVLHEGVYAAVLGPNYETPAEIRFLKTIGADLVGMSTVPEAITANHLGLEVLGIACVTNLAAGLGPVRLVHEDVLAIAQRVSSTFVRLLSTLIPALNTPSEPRL